MVTVSSDTYGSLMLISLRGHTGACLCNFGRSFPPSKTTRAATASSPRSPHSAPRSSTVQRFRDRIMTPGCGIRSPRDVCGAAKNLDGAYVGHFRRPAETIAQDRGRFAELRVHARAVLDSGRGLIWPSVTFWFLHSFRNINSPASIA